MLYRLSKRADRDLLGIFLFGVERFGEEQADRYHSDLESAFELLGRHPGIAREQPGVRGAVRIHFHQSHAIVYRLEKSGILIVRVLHASQDWRRHL